MKKEISSEPKISEKYSAKRQFKDLWFYAEKYRKQLVVYFFFTMVIALIAMAPPYLYGLIIDDLTKKVYTNIFLFLGLTALSHILFQTLQNFLTYKTKILSAIIHNASKIKTFNHLFSLDYEFYETTPMGQLLSRIDKGSKSVRDLVKLLYNGTLVKFFGMLFSLGILFTLNFTVAIATLIVSILFWTYTVYSKNKLIELENEVYSVSEKIYAKVFDFLSNIKIVKLLNIKNKLIKKLDNSYTDVINHEKISRGYERKKIAIQKLFLELANVGILSYLAFLVMQDSLSIGIAVMIFGFSNKFLEYVKAMWGAYGPLITQRTGMYRMSLIYDIQPTIKEPKHPKKPTNWKEITFSNLNFKYSSKAENALKNVSLKIKKGEKIAIVGLSGSGKSTLAKLLMKLYLPIGGDIKFGTTNLKDIHSRDLYELMKMVPQENDLINTTIYQNLQLTTQKNATKQEMINALKNSASWEFIKKLPKKLETIIGPEGTNLSGGEKQRICIARALLTKPQIILLDEATSNLDVITEKKVHTALHNLSEDTTLVAITHRISSVELFDRIIVMHDGKVVGKGTHKELLKNNKYYNQLQEAAKESKK